MKRLCVAIAIAIATFCVTNEAAAGLVTINFPDDVVDPPGFHNTIIDGFTFSPSSHYDLLPADLSINGITGLGWDRSGGPNAAYLGPQPGPFPTNYAKIYIDHGGTAFSLVGVELQMFLSPGIEIASSKGGILTVATNASSVDLLFNGSHPQWTDIDWLMFGYQDPGLPIATIEQLVLSIDEPAAILLFGSCLFGLAVVIRRRTQLGIAGLPN
jgi:hypothetical protein